jgi:N-acyl homoserine lactone hydrolase
MTMAFARRMWALDCPTLTVDAATLGYGLSGMMTIPMPAFLIEHPKGLVLFDTGIDPDALDDPVAVYGQELADGLGMTSRPEQRIDRQLDALGYKTSDVTHVICSHMHFDHSGGHHLFPQAKFFVGEGELEFAHYPDPIGSFCFIPMQLERIRGFDWHVIPGIDLDLFGDGSLMILFMPGHTPGELSLKVRLASRTFILTGDAVHLRSAYEKEHHFPIDADNKTALRTIRRLKRLEEAEEATVWIHHDPGDWAQFQKAPYFYE